MAAETHGAGKEEFLAYVGPLAGELARLARAHHLPTLAYLLDMVRLEAKGQASVHPLKPGAPAPRQDLGSAVGLTADAPARR
ncbi:hypothetical protein [Azorhizobium caulinodans]|uniref:hypothetical protein n=1 Tax=Azorhizobium caulinodans TaxID=7 RepID=UPI0002DCB6F2|nr:hypothetical protein [Azorhizobium caulinodans]